MNDIFAQKPKISDKKKCIFRKILFPNIPRSLYYSTSVLTYGLRDTQYYTYNVYWIVLVFSVDFTEFFVGDYWTGFSYLVRIYVLKINEIDTRSVPRVLLYMVIVFVIGI